MQAPIKDQVHTELGNLFNLIHQKQTQLNQLELLIDQATTAETTAETSTQLQEVKKDLIQTLKKQGYSMLNSGIYPMIANRPAGGWVSPLRGPPAKGGHFKKELKKKFDLVG